MAAAFIPVNILFRKNYIAHGINGTRQVERMKVQKWQDGRRTGNPVVNIHRIAGQGKQ